MEMRDALDANDVEVIVSLGFVIAQGQRRRVMPQRDATFGDRDVNSSAVFPHSVGQEAFIPVSGGRKSCLKAVHSGSTSAPLMDDGS